MVRHYSPKSFFRNMPNALLARYFRTHRLLRDFDFTRMRERNPEPLFAEWVKLPADRRDSMDAEFQEIFALSCAKGTQAIIDEASYWIVTVEKRPLQPFIDWLSSLKNHYERAFQTFLRHRKYWKGAVNFFHADTLSYWRKRKNLPKVPAQTDNASLKQLASMISNYFHNTEGKGKNCLVEPFRRGDLDYFFAYPEDYSQRSIEWVGGQFKFRPHNPAFEIIFVYSEKEGTLDLHYQGDRKAVEPLQANFAEAILKQEELPADPTDTRVYDLDPLKHRDFAMQYEPGSGIEDVRITRMRLSSRIKQGDRIILEGDYKSNPDAVYDLLDGVSKGLPVHLYNVTRVEFAATVIVAADKPPKEIKFHVTHPNSCSLKYDEVDLLLRHMLERSGIELKEPTAVKDSNE